ncbi:mycofactocin system transcriptional regulator [Mycolicibacterium mucogenicum]|uniref:Mycofactocin system transcriptional regulator n=1 Tax=Mycolicibacterium mucogenicum DSM 44124 TaxID=1226753 RepID=A0A8H2JGJ3_MYCMU|nr:mycofactocin system transcriptional regulator [Mycolicibacterium mucogenicum]KAB7755580.1 TetR family transcriptional regulator [Mycolicibacterium mucogenicum DSM 44124]QPG68319.1 mycofactocin system transcriptional regulator [Mycolicibacterium mucogenicum DSM 44124]
MRTETERPGHDAGAAPTHGRVGRRRSTTRDHITHVALELFATRGFDDVSVDDVAHAAGISRRTLFRYFSSKNAIPWADFDASLTNLRDLLNAVPHDVPLDAALRSALLEFNSFDESETPRHRRRMQVILQTDALQAYSMTMYAGWRGVIAAFVARRLDTKPTALVPQTVAWTVLGVALTAYEQWLADETVSLPDALGEAFDIVRDGIRAV